MITSRKLRTTVSFSESISSKIAVEILTLGLCTKYTPREIEARFTSAGESLARAMEELREFGSLFSNEEFDLHASNCSTLTQLVIKQTTKIAATKSRVVKMKKFNAMLAIAQEYEDMCIAEEKAVNESSERAKQIKKIAGLKNQTAKNDLDRRVQRVERLINTLSSVVPHALDLGSKKHVLVTPDEASPGSALLLTNTMPREATALEAGNGFCEPSVKYTSGLLCEAVEVNLDDVDPKMKPLVERLQAVFGNEEKYRRLLACQNSSIQRLLDMFQRLLDTLEVPPSFRRNLIVATQRLAGLSGLYPTGYELTEVMRGKFYSRGGFGDIYEGIFQGRPVCLKVISMREVSQQRRWRKDCAQESILWGQLSHPNVLPFYGICPFSGNQIAFVSPWMKNGHVNMYLEQHPAANRLSLILDIAHGLRCLHENRIIHGDLKGNNVLVNDSGRACLADFGISSISDNNILAVTSQSSVASRGGTLYFQAPELLYETRNSPESDIYAWACCAYEIFTGNGPFFEIRPPDVIDMKRNGRTPARPSASSLSWSEWGLTESIWSLMQDCWSTDRHKRPTVGKIIGHLTAMLESEDIPTPERELRAASSAQTREVIRGGMKVDELSVDVLESLIEASAPFDDGDV